MTPRQVQDLGAYTRGWRIGHALLNGHYLFDCSVERTDDARIELRALAAPNLGYRVVNAQGRPIGSPRRQDVKRVSYRADAPGERNRITSQPFGISCPVEAFMVRQRDGCGRVEQRRRVVTQQLVSDDR